MMDPEPEPIGTVAELALRAQAYACRTTADDDVETISLQTAKEYLEAQDIHACESICNELIDGRETPRATRAAAYLIVASMRQDPLGQLHFVVDLYQAMYQRMQIENNRKREVKELLRRSEGLRNEAQAASLRAQQERENAERAREEWLKYEYGDWP